MILIKIYQNLLVKSVVKVDQYYEIKLIWMKEMQKFRLILISIILEVEVVKKLLH